MSCSYVLEGILDFIEGKRAFRRSADFTGSLPKDIVHTSNNVGDRQCRPLGAVVPSGFENFIWERAHPLTDSMEPPPISTKPVMEKIDGCYAWIRNRVSSRSQPHRRRVPHRTNTRASWVLWELVTTKLVSNKRGGNLSAVEVTIFPDEV
jgi:hypothetical protein